MEKYNNDIEHFVYKFCYKELRRNVNEKLMSNSQLLDLQHSKIKWPDSYRLLDLIIESITNISINNDELNFTTNLSCIINLFQETVRGEKEEEIITWLSADCCITITDQIDDFKIKNIQKYKKQNSPKSINYTKNIVPIITKEKLDDEAEEFLREYYPIALDKPCAVPIEQIANNMGLEVIKGYRLTNNFSIFGQICFSKGKLPVYDLFNCNKIDLDVNRGTILIDTYTFWERNLGCVNNTIAHEVFHWYKHRMYAQIKQILNNEKLIACRCPTSLKNTDNKWDDTAVMEWQANSIAPRILMPLKTFKIKVDELYKKYDYENTPIKIAVMTCIADELADFYNVSRQSAVIRMIEAGYDEARALNSYKKENSLYSYLTRYDAIYAYQANDELKKLIDNQLFVYADGYYVINDEDYYETDSSGKRVLTSFAWANLENCVLFFNSLEFKNIESNTLKPNIIFHRDNGSNTVPGFDKKNNKEVIKNAELIKRKKKELENDIALKNISSDNKTSWQFLNEIVDAKQMSKSHFMSATNLGEEVYRKMKKNQGIPELRTIMAIGCGLHLPTDTVEILLKLSGHAFSESKEDKIFKSCLNVCSDMDINQINDLLEEYDIKPLGTQKRQKSN